MISPSWEEREELEQYERAKKKYDQYLSKNKLLLAQLQKLDKINEQEVNFIAIEIADVSFDNTCDAFIGDIVKRNSEGFGILETLYHVKNGNYHRELKKTYKNLRSLANNKHLQLTDKLAEILGQIRGENTLLQFDLAYSNIRFEPDDDGRMVRKQIYILKLLPPNDDVKQICTNFNSYDDDHIFWKLDDHDNIHTQKHKWLSGNHAWRWDDIKKVWITNDVRPWYFTIYPSPVYTKNINEWDRVMSEIISEELTIKNNVEKISNQKQKPQRRQTVVDMIIGLLPKKYKVHTAIENDEKDVRDELSSIKSKTSTDKLTADSYT
jgi:hypothetical protein